MPEPSGTRMPLLLNTPWARTNWKSLKLGYLATDRDDMAISPAIMKVDNSNEASLCTMTNPRPSSMSRNSLLGKLFLSGFDVASRNKWEEFGFNTGQPVFKPDEICASVNSKNNATINSVMGNFVVFDPKNVSFLFILNTIEQNFLNVQHTTTIDKRNLASIEHYLVGVSSFAFDAANVISFTSDLDNFTLKISPILSNQINYVSFHYLIIARGPCSDCVGYPILYNGSCWASCPFGTVLRGLGCEQVRCPPNSEWDGSNCYCKTGFHPWNQSCIICTGDTEFDPAKGCVCKPNFYIIDGKCQRCSQNSFFNGTNCQCLNNFYLINGVCDQCRVNEQWYPEWNKCGQSCGKNSFFDGNNCVCLKGFFVIRGQCDVCPYGFYYRESTRSCAPYCFDNERWNGTTCACVDGYNRINGVCDVCKENSAWNGKECACLEGFFDINCKCQRCPPNRSWNPATSSCELPPLKCADGEDSNGYICVCKPGFNLKNGTCYADCPANSGYKDGKCVCNPGFKAVDSKCLEEICADPNALKVGPVCICKPGFSLVNTVCTATPAPVTPTTPPTIAPVAPIPQTVAPIINPTVPSTVAPTGPNVYCHSTAYWNGQACVCGYGYSMFGGICIAVLANKCPNGQSWNGFQCVCDLGLTLVSGACVNTTVSTTCSAGAYWNGLQCVCLGGYQLSGSSCVLAQSCPAPFVWTGSSCACPAGQIQIGSTCGVAQNCYANAYWNGVQCVCNSGFNFLNGGCSAVPQIQCGANAIFNGVSCVCLQGFFKGANNLCSGCPTQQYWNGMSCTGGSSIQPYCRPGTNWNGRWCEEWTPRCISNSFWDGIRCACNRGFHNVTNFCMRCPTGTYYNGYSCVYGSEYNTCGANQIWNGNSCVCANGFYQMGN